MMNRAFSHKEGIRPKVPPKAPAIRNAWKRVREVRERASSRLGVQNLIAFMSNNLVKIHSVVKRRVDWDIFRRYPVSGKQRTDD